MKRITLLTLVAFCGAAIAANTPRSVIHGKTDHERRVEVFSGFVALSDTRGADTLPFLSNLAELTGERRRMQQKRLDRAAPPNIGCIGRDIGVGAGGLSTRAARGPRP